MPVRYGKLIKNGINYSHDTADSISYVNTSSGLAATDVQAAIDEIKADFVSKANGGTFENSIYVKGDIAITPVSGSTIQTIGSNAYGTTSQVGVGSLTAGNSIAEGTEGNSKGRLRLYSNSAQRIDLYAADNMDSDKIIKLPNPSDNNQVLAMQSEIPDDFVSKANGGTFEKSIYAIGNIATTAVSGTTVSTIGVQAYGTTGTVGAAILSAGNNIAEGTEGNSRGRLRLYSDSAKRIDLYAAENMTADRAIKLPNPPDNSQVLAMQSEIPDDFVSKANGGTFEGNINVVNESATTALASSIIRGGNNTAEGTTGNSRGLLRLYSNSTGYIDLTPASGVTGSAILRLPSGKNGQTLACLNDVNNVQQNYVTNTNANYRVLYSTTANDIENSGEVHKGGLIFNPGTTSGSTIVSSTLVMKWGDNDILLDGIGGVYVTHNNNRYAMISSPSEQQLFIRSSSEQSYAVKFGVWNSRWMWAPYVDSGAASAIYLGGPNYKWKAIYAGTATIDTSDRNQKKDIVDLDSSAKDFIMDLKPVSYKFKNIDEENPTHDRTHYGLIAQDVEDTMTKLGMTALDFGGFCKDQKTIPNEENPAESVIVEGEYTYGLRYAEFISPLIKTVQMQEQKINELEAMIKDLQAAIK